MNGETDIDVQEILTFSSGFVSLLLTISCLFFLPSCSAEAAPPDTVQVTLGRAVVSLNGPWKFHTGDDPLWAQPDFDDSAWETVDLTPSSPDAHDPDVGLTGYVSGWQAKGHRDYSGYSWYRIRVSVDALQGEALALCAPYYADSAYQVFSQGELLGGSGDFSKRPPVVYNIHIPKFFLLPQSARASSEKESLLIAVRAWMNPIFLRMPDSGGIHIAPALGTIQGVKSLYQHQWNEMIYGYIVDATEAVLFLLLAVMVCALIPFDRSDPAYRWVAAALVLIALARGNQAVVFWWQFESFHEFEVLTPVLFVPLSVAAWTLAWCYWFRLRERAWMPTVAGILALLYAVSQFLRRSWFSGVLPHSLSGAALFCITSIRWLFGLLTLLILFRVLSQSGKEKWFGLPAVLLLSIGLFTSELTKFHIPGIWFPFGVGVSLNEYAYMPFDVALFAMLLHRLYVIASDKMTRRSDYCK